MCNEPVVGEIHIDQLEIFVHSCSCGLIPSYLLSAHGRVLLGFARGQDRERPRQVCGD
jgi:hypothetical protein